MEKILQSLQKENEKLKQQLIEKDKIITAKSQDEILGFVLQELKQAQLLKERYEALLQKLKENDKKYQKLYETQEKMFQDLQEELKKIKNLKPFDSKKRK